MMKTASEYSVMLIIQHFISTGAVAEQACLMSLLFERKSAQNLFVFSERALLECNHTLINNNTIK